MEGVQLERLLIEERERLEAEIKKEEVLQAMMSLGGDKALCSDIFPIFSFSI